MKKIIKDAIKSTQRAQRNYNLEKQIPSDDLETLIYSAINSPSKQNETHYSVHVLTDGNLIYEIYKNTKKFALIDNETKTFGINEKGEYWHNHLSSITNSQILSNSLFAFVEEQGYARGGTHLVAKSQLKTKAWEIYNEQINYSIGIAVGELILTAGLLGYKTGICSAFDTKKIKEILGTNNKIKLLVGVGFDNCHKDRRLHPEVLNKDVPEKFRNGKDVENWRFPSFEKECKVFLNGKDYFG